MIIRDELSKSLSVNTITDIDLMANDTLTQLFLSLRGHPRAQTCHERREVT
jgi:hypothetical protein